MTDITQIDLYKLLEIDEKCSTQEIATAFRRKALKCHPDKFPDDKDKAETFLNIKKALEILTDEKARSAYDADRKIKKIHQERLSQMDDKRKKFKQDLERNEQKASQTTTTPTVNKSNTNRLNVEIERLRREGSRLVDEELEKLHTILEQDKQKVSSNHVNIVIKYIPDTQTYTDDELRQIFQKYGNISTIINMPKRALIEFNDDHVSNFIENEKGFDGRTFASVKIKKLPNTTTTPSSTTKKQNDLIDLTKPDFEDFEAMMLKKMAQQTTTS
jgi:DnaJ family protein C protein 17